MPKKSKQNKSKSKVSIWLFFSAAVGLFFLSIFLFIFVQSLNNTNTIPASVRYAAGPKISYNDPLIRDVKILYPKVLPDDVRRGSANAKVTIFYYCDLFSPLCKIQQDEIYKLLAIYPETILRLVWKGTASTNEGMLVQQAVYCANAQGKFWEYQHEVFMNQENIDLKFLESIAAALNLSVNEFNTCLNEGQMENKVYENNIEATDLEIDAVPYFFIDNTPYRGLFTSEELSEIINEKL